MGASPRRLASPLAVLAALALLSVGGCSDEHVISITVTPADASVSQTGQTMQFQAMGTTNHTNVPPGELSSVTWSSSATSIATINASGLATATGCGTTTISATDGSIVGQTTLTNTCTLTTGQTTPVLQSISVYPSAPSIPQVGQTTQFIALGAYSPASTNNNLTTSVSWQSSNTAVATVSSSGLATATGCGTSTITAQSSGVLGQTTLTVSCTTPPVPVLQSINLFPSSPSIPQLGQTTQFIALAVYSPAASNNVLTNAATWASSNTGIAATNSTGLVTAVACGTTTITAEYQGVVGQTVLTVVCTGGQTLQSIEVLPNEPTIPQIGQTTQFAALGTLVQGGQTDVTNTATWTSSNTQVATVNGAGLATAVSCGTTTISAESQSIAGTSLLTVSCSAIASVELLVVETGSPGEVIVSSPDGISCGTLCGALFNAGTGLTLMATSPATWTGCDQVSADQTECYLTVRAFPAGGTSEQITANF